MSESARIHAVTVTHDSADFVELMLRTLFLTNNLADLEFAMTVLIPIARSSRVISANAGFRFDRPASLITSRPSNTARR